MAFIAKQVELAQNRTMIKDSRPVAVKRMNVLERVATERKRMKDENRALLMRFESFDAFNQWVRRNRLPEGSFYLVPTAELYGAPGSSFDFPADRPIEDIKVVQENANAQVDLSVEAARARLDALANGECNDFPDASRSTIYRRPHKEKSPSSSSSYRVRDDEIPW
ncbi:hypothetical protein [Ochrobactrum soli]|nr:hypothetical protein [[Ochrobactrum] soli]